jgi:hypothetical protein
MPKEITSIYLRYKQLKEQAIADIEKNKVQLTMSYKPGELPKPVEMPKKKGCGCHRK